MTNKNSISATPPKHKDVENISLKQARGVAERGGNKKKSNLSAGWSRSNPPPYNIISLKPKYWLFVEWLTTFKPYRQPSFQGEFAKSINLSEDVISKWKLMPELAVDVLNQIRTHMKSEKVSDVLHGWASRLPSEGRAADIQLFLEYFTGWARRTMVDVTEKTLPPEEKAMIDRVFKENERKQTV